MEPPGPTSAEGPIPQFGGCRSVAPRESWLTNSRRADTTSPTDRASTLSIAPSVRLRPCEAAPWMAWSGRLAHSALVPTAPRRPLSHRLDCTRGGESSWGRARMTTTDEPFRAPQRRSNPDRSALQRADARGDRRRDGARRLDARSRRHAVRTLPQGFARGGRAGRTDSS